MWNIDQDSIAAIHVLIKRVDPNVCEEGCLCGLKLPLFSHLKVQGQCWSDYIILAVRYTLCLNRGVPIKFAVDPKSGSTSGKTIHPVTYSNRRRTALETKKLTRTLVLS